MPTIGASGAIAGVLGGYILLFPRARVVTVIFIVFFFTILELPALLVLGLWFLQQALFGYFDLAQPRAAAAASRTSPTSAASSFGLLAIRLFARQRRRQRTRCADMRSRHRRARWCSSRFGFLRCT